MASRTSLFLFESRATTHQPGQFQQPYQQSPQQSYTQPNHSARMSFDDVLTKSAICLGLVVLVGAITMIALPAGLVFPVSIGFSLVTGIAALVISLQRHITAPMAIGYALLEAVALGALSKLFEYWYPGIVSQAVLGTLVAAIAVYFAVKVFQLRFSRRMATIFTVSMFAYAGAMLVNFLLGLAGINLGLVDGFGQISMLGVVMCLIGTVLAVMSLVKDFSQIAEAIEIGAPATESWRAAFGVTFSMVWLYTEILRILSYLRD